jgi:hypothetical protein
MGEILRFLRQNETWIYILLGVVALFYVFRLLTARRDWKSANFGLEREMIQRRVNSSLTILLLCILFSLAEFVLISFVAPNMANTQKLATPTIDLMVTPTTSFGSLVVSTPMETPAFQPTPTLILILDGCKANLLEWTYPKSGDKIRGTVTLRGTVYFDNLGFYKYEYSQVGSDIWNPIAAGDQKIMDGDLGGPWNTAQLTPGDYRLHLVATDNNDNPFPVCEITISILIAEDQ